MVSRGRRGVSAFMVRHGSARAAQLHVCQDLETLSRQAAAHIVRVLRRQARSAGRVSLALSGGMTPRRVYQLLASDAYRRRIPWERVHLFWTDERCVPLDDPASNFGMAQRTLLSRVWMPAANIHPIRTTGQTPASAAIAYEEVLRECFRPPRTFPTFDLIVLGLGIDGHTASLFPSSAALRRTRRLAVSTSGGDPASAGQRRLQKKFLCGVEK